MESQCAGVHKFYQVFHHEAPENPGLAGTT
jgi:hypothetical protein